MTPPLEALKEAAEEQIARHREYAEASFGIAGAAARSHHTSAADLLEALLTERDALLAVIKQAASVVHDSKDRAAHLFKESRRYTASILEDDLIDLSEKLDATLAQHPAPTQNEGNV